MVLDSKSAQLTRGDKERIYSRHTVCCAKKLEGTASQEHDDMRLVA